MKKENMNKEMKLSELAKQIMVCIASNNSRVELRNGFILYCRIAYTHDSSNPNHLVFDLEYEGEVKKTLCIVTAYYPSILKNIEGNKIDLLKLGFIDDISDSDVEDIKEKEPFNPINHHSTKRMKLSELIEKLENWERMGGSGKPTFDGKKFQKEGHLIEVEYNGEFVFIDSRPSIRMGVYSSSFDLSKLGFIDDFTKAPIPKISELIDAIRASRYYRETIRFADFELRNKENGVFEIFKDRKFCKSLRIKEKEDIIDAINAIKDDLIKIGFIYDLKNISDPINPTHYNKGGIECIDALKSSMTREAFLGHLKATAIAYLWRYEDKGGLEDIKKTKWYVEKLIETLEEQ